MEILFALLLISSPLLVPFGIILYQNKQHKKTTYYQITKNSYSSIKYDKGKYGEYLIYKRLQHFENNGGRFLFNIFIPKENNGTTEIDVLLICSKGLFVFESKNYGGWIFGNEKQKNWIQILPRGRGYSRKERFYNPVMQNASHIKYLKRVVGEKLSMHSIIVFSDQCTLMGVTVTRNNVSVLNCRDLLSATTRICDQTYNDLLTTTEINNLYNKLWPYTQVSYDVKSRHTKNIQKY